MQKSETSQPKKRRRVSRKTIRLIIVSVGVGLGLSCYLVPLEYQKPCALLSGIITKLAGVP